MFFIYILYSTSSDKYNVGYTTDINRRLNEHNHQEFFNKFTSKHRPWTLRALFSYGDNEETAVQLERFIKKNHSRKLIEKLIDPDFEPDGQLAQLVIP